MFWVWKLWSISPRGFNRVTLIEGPGAPSPGREGVIRRHRRILHSFGVSQDLIMFQQIRGLLASWGWRVETCVDQCLTSLVAVHVWFGTHQQLRVTRFCSFELQALRCATVPCFRFVCQHCSWILLLPIWLKLGILIHFVFDLAEPCSAPWSSSASLLS